MSFKTSYGITRDSGEESISDNTMLLVNTHSIVINVLVNTHSIVINSQTAVSCILLILACDSMCRKTIMTDFTVKLNNLNEYAY